MSSLKITRSSDEVQDEFEDDGYTYHCSNCGEGFDEPEQCDESFSVPYGEGSVIKHEYSQHCPYCYERVWIF